MPIMESYLTSPELHAESVLNPQMRGGPFMDFAENRSGEIETLREETIRGHERQLAFSKAVRELDTLLETEAKGYCLEALYAKVPRLLRGYVELYYDRNNHPGFRFFESLLYASEFYDRRSQSMAFWVTSNDHRPFVLSTPRLDDPGVLHVNIPFDHPGIDMLAGMKREARDRAEVAEALGVPAEQAKLFETFFTGEAPPAYKAYSGDKIRMRYFGHACILIETKEVNILVDPLISYYGYHSDIEHFSDVDLPDRIDYVLITHNHQDHILFETLLPMRHKIGKIIVPASGGGKLEDPDLRLMFEHVGFTQVIDMDEMEEVRSGEVSITSLPFTGEHSDLNIMAKACYFVRIGKFKLIFMADSRIMEPAIYKHIQKRTGDVDIIFLGMECDGAPLSWLYGPLFTKKIQRDQDGSRRLSGSDCMRGMSLVDIFHPREVYVYAMGQEPWVEFISSVKYTDESNPIVQSNKLVDICRSRGIIAERLYGEKELLYGK